VTVAARPRAHVECGRAVVRWEETASSFLPKVLIAMGVLSADAPQWFCSSFVRTCRGAGATADEDTIRATGTELIERWSEPHRHFHNLRHLAAVLHRVDELAHETHEPDLVRLAAWYHGAVFDADRKVAYATRGGEQTTLSADLARTQLTELGMSARAADRVGELVDNLARHKPLPNDFDSAVLNDADLGMLAAEPQRYKAYVAEIRSEYGHIPLPDYLDARIKVVTKLLGRPRLYSSPLGITWEEPARQNLDAELHRLTKERRRLAAQSPVGPSPR
jgi:predicted metal-dependent HD superfamily phosphohydrolase